MNFYLSNSLFAALLVSAVPPTVYGKGYLKSGNPTNAGGASAIAMELGDQQRRALAPLDYLVVNPPPGSPLGLCQGDCDDNSECEGDLVCFERIGEEEVPGCSGTVEGSFDFCVPPIHNGIPVLDWVGHSSPDGSPLKVCQGDCDTDAECGEGLVCFQRNDYDAVPGCFGSGVEDHDYCIIDPNANSPYDAAPTYDIQLDTTSTNGGCVFAKDETGSATDIGDITCTFTALGGVGHKVSSEVLADNDCSSLAPVGVTQDANPNFEFTTLSDTEESSTYTVKISLAKSAAPAGSTSIDFCLKTEVKDKDDFVYDWIGQTIQLTVNVNGAFSTSDLKTTAFVGNTLNAASAGKADFGVGVERCDEFGNVVTDSVLSLGDNLFFCVTGQQSVVLINSIQQLTASKDGENLSLVTYAGDGSGAGDLNPNTFVYGTGTNNAVIATRLPSTFFSSTGEVILSGTANISTGGRRQLVRSMQEASESGDFSMEVKIAGSSDASGASAIKATATVFFGAVAAALFSM